MKSQLLKQCLFPGSAERGKEHSGTPRGGGVGMEGKIFFVALWAGSPLEAELEV